MITTLTFANAVGRKSMADALGVKPTAVSNAVVRGTFPASWFLVLQALAREKKAECPPELFGMRAPPQDVDAAAPLQGDAAA